MSASSPLYKVSVFSLWLSKNNDNCRTYTSAVSSLSYFIHVDQQNVSLFTDTKSVNELSDEM